MVSRISPVHSRIFSAPRTACYSLNKSVKNQQIIIIYVVHASMKKLDTGENKYIFIYKFLLRYHEVQYSDFEVLNR